MPHSATQNTSTDTGLVCTVILADPQQLRHEFAASGEAFENREILRAARLLGLKARAVTSRWDRLSRLNSARHRTTQGWPLFLSYFEARLAIARNLLTNPRVLIFDEATSALDYESERIIQKNMRAICQDRTVRGCDNIIVMDKGRSSKSAATSNCSASKASTQDFTVTRVTTQSSPLPQIKGGHDSQTSPLPRGEGQGEGSRERSNNEKQPRI